MPHGGPGLLTGPRADDRLKADLLGERDPLVHGVDRPAGHADRHQLVEPLARRLGRELLDEQRPQQVAVGSPVRVVQEPRVIGQFGCAEHLTELAELYVVACRDDQVAVSGVQWLVGEEARVRVAHPERHHAPGRIGARLVHHAGHRRRHEGRIEVLPLARGVPVVERGEDADRGVQPGHHVERRDACPVRRSRRVPGEGHQAGHRLHHEVIAGQVAAAAAEPADRCVDNRRVSRADRVVVEAEPGEAARLEVLHEHVRAAREFRRQREVAVVLQVERDRPFVPVDRQEIGRDAVVGDRRHP